jgi:hypothetical protein
MQIYALCISALGDIWLISKLSFLAAWLCKACFNIIPYLARNLQLFFLAAINVVGFYIFED